MTEDVGTTTTAWAAAGPAAAAPAGVERHPLAHPIPEPVPVRGLNRELIDLDCYAVTYDGATIGFVDVVGRVYVALAGRYYCRAVEVAQSLVFERGVAAVAAASDVE